MRLADLIIGVDNLIGLTKAGDLGLGPVHGIMTFLDWHRGILREKEGFILPKYCEKKTLLGRAIRRIATVKLLQTGRDIYLQGSY